MVTERYVDRQVRQLLMKAASTGAPCVVQAPYEAAPNNSVIAFHDNSSALRGGEVTPLLPVTCGQPSPLKPQSRDWDLLLTAETHNFPCAVAPYPGA